MFSRNLKFSVADFQHIVNWAICKRYLGILIKVNQLARNKNKNLSGSIFFSFFFQETGLEGMGVWVCVHTPLFITLNNDIS